jgi:hypothetical protein
MVSSNNKTDHHDITEILLKVALNTINPNPENSKTVKGNGNPRTLPCYYQ